MTYSLVNAGAKKALDVNGQGTKEGTPIGLYESNAEANQEWSFRETEVTGIKVVNIQTPVNVVPELPARITHYTWGRVSR